jgi:hypothetical protein
LALRLAQATAWCTPRVDTSDPASSLRSDELRPWVLESDRAATVHQVLDSRAQHVRAAAPVRTRDHLRNGRLLLYYPDASLSDGAAEAETDGFFDVHNVPPWDTWLGLFRDGSSDPSFTDYIVSWVPGDLVPLVERGISVNPEQCILWLADAPVPLVKTLRSLDLLG